MATREPLTEWTRSSTELPPSSPETSPWPGSARSVAGKGHACREGTEFMRTGLLTVLMVGMAMTSSGGRAAAQGRALPPDSGLRIERIEWTAEPGGKWQHVCGYLYNDTPGVPREGRLLVEARDSSGQIVDSRVAYVLGYVAPRGRTYFCSVAIAGAARYSVTVLGGEWTADR